MQAGPRAGRRIQYGHVAFLVAVAAYAIWRLVDARAASSSFQNLLLIEPVVFGMLALVAVIAFGVIVRRQGGAEDEAAPIPDLAAAEAAPDAPPADEKRDLLQVAAAMVLTAVFLALIPPLGLDVATFLFVAAALYLQGERRVWMVVLVPAVFAFVVVHGFKALLPTPIPTFFG